MPSTNVPSSVGEGSVVPDTQDVFGAGHQEYPLGPLDSQGSDDSSLVDPRLEVPRSQQPNASVRTSVLNDRSIRRRSHRRNEPHVGLMAHTRRIHIETPNPGDTFEEYCKRVSVCRGEGYMFNARH